MKLDTLPSQYSHEIMQFRHELHRNAEVSNKESLTPELVKNFLGDTGASEVVEGLGGSGLALVYRGEQEGPTILIRAELDALPIPETLDLEYASQNKGVSHKCGHDGHMAMIAGVGRLLGQWPLKNGNVILLFQPAEETGEGARQVLQDRRFHDLKPDYLFALHNLPGYPEGEIILKNDVFSSASRGFIARLHGQTSHAGHPEHARTPKGAIAGLMQELPGIPAMKLPLHRAGLITVIHARLGEIAFGTTPGHGEVMATLRAHYNEDIEILAGETERMVRGYCNTYELEYETEWVEVFEATENDESCVELIENSAQRNGFPVRWIDHAFPWSEDFGQFTRDYCGALFGLGSGENHPQLHRKDYDFPDNILPGGTLMFWNIIHQVLETKKKR